VIILDTNIVSEAMKPRPEETLLHWIDAQYLGVLYITSISVAELFSGIEIMPVGRRRDEMRELLTTSLERFFGSRVLPFDVSAALAYASIFANGRKEGISIGLADGQIAAIAKVHGYSVATRDERPFRAAGVRVINPWKA
jgi:predicted nucleic acid-binding protein